MPLHYFLFPLATVLIWTGNLTVNKLAAGAIAPTVIAFDRWVLAILVLSPFVLPSVWRLRATIRPQLPKLAVLGLLGLAVWQGLAYFAAETISATNMGILSSLIPLLTVLMSVLVLGEQPSVGAVLGGVLALLGLFILLGRGDPLSLLSIGVGIGDALMIVACIAYACYSVLLRRWQIPLPRWTSVYLQACFAALFLLPGYLLGRSSPLTAQNIWLVLYAAIPVSILSTFLWMVSIRLLGANRASIFINLLPVLTVAVAVLFLGETLHGYHVVGGGLALCGVALAQTITRPLPGGRSAIA